MLCIDPDALSTLETLIAPGKQTRLSRLVQTAQARIALDCGLGPASHELEWRALLDAKSADMQRLADRWVDHLLTGGSSGTNVYNADDALFRAAVIEHASRRIPQLQLVLVDLMRQRALPDDLRVLLIGEDAGIKAIAIFDLLLALQDACDLYEILFPFQSVRFMCAPLDNRAHANNTKLVATYTAALPASYQRSSMLELDVNAFHIPVEWWTGERGQLQQDQLSRANLVVLDGAVDEEDWRSWLETQLRGCLQSATTIVLQPGGSDDACELMCWRKDLLARIPSVGTLGPCGSEFGSNLPDSCLRCSPRRQEAFHRTALCAVFAEQLDASVKRKLTGANSALPADPLSWSYVILQGNTIPRPGGEPFAVPLPVNQILEGPVQIRYMSTYTSSGLADYHPDAFDENDPDAKEFIQLCPACAGVDRLALRRTRGKQIPPLRYGELVKAEKVWVSRVRNQDAGFILDVTEDTQFTSCSEPTAPAQFLHRYGPQARRAVDRVANRLFGFETMHEFQHAILAEALMGKHIVCIAATGGGKSECFILPAMLLPGITLVVSPLKSLMQDQFEQRLRRRYGLDYLSTYINGDVKFRERQARLKRLELGHYKLVYLTPEQLERGYVLESLRRANERIGIRYLAMDEAHCISQWGHDFRPSYLNIVHRLHERGIDPVRIGLTATASPNVRQDLCDELDLVNAQPPAGHVLVVSSNRPELNLVVRVQRTTADKVEQILADLQQFLRDNRGSQTPDAAIVFMPHAGSNPESLQSYYPDKDPDNSRMGRLSANVTRFASYVERKLRRRVSIYHGKMDNDDEANGSEGEEKTLGQREKPFGDLTDRTRTGEQNAFIEGQRDIMIATKGFGMGIDKANIRLVIHRTPTANLEAYAQEAGRAGRDGEQANVILYYSPDAPQDETSAGTSPVKSDHEIQSFFIGERYVRREDVLVMRAFLRSVERRAAGRFYFTGDEALRFFEFCRTAPAIAGLGAPYQWPKFADWEPLGAKFTGEHRAVMERGHVYKSKIDYIGRILATLYRIRPDVAALGRRVAFLESSQKTDAAVRQLKTCQAHEIVRSNHYFGRELRDKGVAEAELDDLIGEGARSDLFPLAERLGLSMVDTVGMLTDIKFSEGAFDRNGEWQSELLKAIFVAPKYVDWPNAETLQGWRDYAGAWKRGRPNKPKGAQTTIDDWFPWRTLNQPVGWEVQPGPAFAADEVFGTYLEEFMRLHDDRQRNDWDSYYRLLTDYVGVNSDGTLPTSAGRRNCLRSALLGYLKTSEVVVGGNCFSCNVCVPDERFGIYTMEQRRGAVVRMSDELQAELSAYEGLAHLAPSPEQLQRLAELVASEESHGRAVRTYVLTWSARLLQDMPGHRGALWLRLYAASIGMFSIEPRELASIGQQLLERGSSQELGRLSQTLESLDNGDAALYAGFVTLLAQMAERQTHTEQALALWTRALKLQPSEQLEFEIHRAIVRLSEATGALPDTARHLQHATAAGWLASTWEEASTFFAPVAAGRTWPQIEGLAEDAGPRRMNSQNHAALVSTWLFQGRADAAQALPGVVRILLDQDPAVWNQIPDHTLLALLDRIPSDTWFSLRKGFQLLAERLAKRTEPSVRSRLVELQLVALGRGMELDHDEDARLASDLLSTSSQAQATRFIALLDKTGDRTLVARRLAPHFHPGDWAVLARWLIYFPPEILLSGDGKLALDFLSTVRQVIVSTRTDLSHADRPLQGAIRLLRDRVFDRPNLVPEAHLIWTAIIASSSQEQLDYLKLRLERGYESPAELEAQLLARLVAAADEKQLADAVGQLSQFPRRSEMPGLEEALEFYGLFVEALRLCPDLRSSRPNSGDLQALAKAFSPGHSQARASMLAAAIEALRRHYSPSWLTPVACLVEALTLAGRYAEAENVARYQADLRIGPTRIIASSYIRDARSRSVASSRPPLHAAKTIEHMAQLLSQGERSSSPTRRW